MDDDHRAEVPARRHRARGTRLHADPRAARRPEARDDLLGQIEPVDRPAGTIGNDHRAASAEKDLGVARRTIEAARDGEDVGARDVAVDEHGQGQRRPRL